MSFCFSDWVSHDFGPFVSPKVQDTLRQCWITDQHGYSRFEWVPVALAVPGKVIAFDKEPDTHYTIVDVYDVVDKSLRVRSLISKQDLRYTGEKFLVEYETQTERQERFERSC